MTDPYALNGLVHYTRSGKDVSETYSQAWFSWLPMTTSICPENRAYAERLRIAMNEADEQSKEAA